MKISELHAATEAFASILSEATVDDLDIRVGDSTLAEVCRYLADRNIAVAAELNPSVHPHPSGVPGPPNLYGGGFENGYRRTAKIVLSAAESHDAAYMRGALETLISDTRDAATAVSHALQLE